MDARPRDRRLGSRSLTLMALAMATAAASCAGGTGGTTGTGGSTGTGTGGTTSTGGTTGTGGSNTGTGGTTSGTGGTNVATGGVTGTGGATSTGGTPGSGGASSTGGTTGTGGSNTGTGGTAGAKGSGGTGGSAGAKGTGGGTPGTGGAVTTGFCPSGAIFCADFEEASGVPTNNPVGTATFEDPSEYGMTFSQVMALDKTAPYAGSQSLKIDPSSSFSIRTLAVAVPTTFWVRLYIKSDQAIGQPNHNSFFAAGLSPDYSTAKNVEVSEQFGCILLNASDSLYPTGTTCGQNTALSANTWHCMAAEFDGTSGNVQVFAGTTQIINAVSFKGAQESFNTFSFGFLDYNTEPNSTNTGNAPAATVWYDDVVVSASPLSCP